MAEITERTPLNAPGKYYNDSTCIDCDLCREIAPTVFTRDDEEGLSYVWRQPVSPTDLDLAKEAATSCPSESIGTDGDKH